MHEDNTVREEHEKELKVKKVFDKPHEGAIDEEETTVHVTKESTPKEAQD